MVREMLAVEFVLVLMNLEFVFVRVRQRSIHPQIVSVEQKGKRATRGTRIDQHRRTLMLIGNGMESKDGLIGHSKPWYGNEPMLNMNRSTMGTGGCVVR